MKKYLFLFAFLAVSLNAQEMKYWGHGGVLGQDSMSTEILRVDSLIEYTSGHGIVSKDSIKSKEGLLAPVLRVDDIKMYTAGHGIVVKDSLVLQNDVVFQQTASEFFIVVGDGDTIHLNARDAFRLFSAIVNGDTVAAIDTTGKAVFLITDASNPADGTVYNQTVVSATESPALNAEVAGIQGNYNWSKGDNQTFTAAGVEGVVRSRGADESMTARGVYGRFYIDPAYSATLRTGVGGEFSARASYNGGTGIAAESGTAFVGVRIWMAPWFTGATIGNVNNFHGLWLYNEHTSADVTNAIYINGASGGGSWTNFLNFRDNADAQMFGVTKNGNVTTAGDIAVNGGDITSTVDIDIEPAGGDVNVDAYVMNDQTVNQTTGRSFAGIQNASLLQDGSAYTGTDVTMSTQWIATKFTASGNHTVGNVRIKIKESSDITNATAYLTGYIYADDGASPSKPSTLVTGATLDNILFGTITNTYQVLSIGSPASAVTLTNGTAYWLVLKYSAATTPATAIRLDSDVSANMGATSADGLAWTNTTERLYIQIMGLTGTGVYAYSSNDTALVGKSVDGYGVAGISVNNQAVYGSSTNSYGGYFTSPNNIGCYGTSIVNHGLYGTSTSGSGVRGISSSSYGLYVVSTSGIGVLGSSTSSYGGDFSVNPSSTNTTAEVVRLTRLTSSTAANNIGLSIDMYLEDTTPANELTGRIANVMTNATSGAETSRLGFWTRTGGAAISEVFSVTSSGIGFGTVLPQHTFSAVGSAPMINVVDSDININRTSAAQASDTASFKVDASTAFPTVTLSGGDGDNYAISGNTSDQMTITGAAAVVPATGTAFILGAVQWDESATDSIDGAAISANDLPVNRIAQLTANQTVKTDANGHITTSGALAVLVGDSLEGNLVKANDLPVTSIAQLTASKYLMTGATGHLATVDSLEGDLVKANDLPVNRLAQLTPSVAVVTDANGHVSAAGALSVLVGDSLEGNLVKANDLPVSSIAQLTPSMNVVTDANGHVTTSSALAVLTTDSLEGNLVKANDLPYNRMEQLTASKYVQTDANGHIATVDSLNGAVITARTIPAKMLVTSPALVTPNIGAATGTSLAVTGNLSGTVPVKLDYTGATALVADSCKGHARYSLAGVHDYTLPSVAAGLVILLYDLGGAVQTIDTFDGTDTIYLDGVSVDAGHAIDSPGAVGNYIALMGIDDTRWITLGRSGTYIDGGAD